MKLFGKPSIHPALFFSGKICGYITWALLITELAGITKLLAYDSAGAKVLSLSVFGIGLIIIILSLINLGGSVSLGLPAEKTVLQTRGVYRICRNPMYLGFNLLTISSMILTLNTAVAAMGIYSLVIYHFIILGEERFLEKRFGKEFMEYKKNVRRYI